MSPNRPNPFHEVSWRLGVSWLYMWANGYSSCRPCAADLLSVASPGLKVETSANFEKPKLFDLLVFHNLSYPHFLISLGPIMSRQFRQSQSTPVNACWVMRLSQLRRHCCTSRAADTSLPSYSTSSENLGSGDMKRLSPWWESSWHAQGWWLVPNQDMLWDQERS